MSKAVGMRIREARTRAGLTQEQLSQKLDRKLTGDDISQAERGLKDLTEAQVRAIARVTGVTGVSLLGKSKAASASATKMSSTKKTAVSAAAREKKPKTPASAGLSMRVTATEKRLVELYRLADGNTKKRVVALLKGDDDTEGGGLSDILSDALSSLIKGK